MKQAMIFAAGLGTRLRPLTDTMPKALVRVGGEPLLHRVIMNLKSAGFERIVVNVHHFAEQIIDYLKTNDNFGLDIRISDESDALLDTGGGIRKAAPLFDPSSPILRMVLPPSRNTMARVRLSSPYIASPIAMAYPTIPRAMVADMYSTAEARTTPGDMSHTRNSPVSMSR